MITKMPAHFRWRLMCKQCSGGMEADGHDSMSIMDTYLAGHIEAFGHLRYNFEIILDKKEGPDEH